MRVRVNQLEVWNGAVVPEISVDTFVANNCVELEIEHYGKNYSQDCVVSDGVIVEDKNCELDQIIVDGYNLEELVWSSKYHTDDNDTLDHCLFFGKNGIFSIRFELPVLRWILKTRHDTLQNDPYWEDDYNSFQTACKILNNLN
jgi:hypothetical protein